MIKYIPSREKGLRKACVYFRRIKVGFKMQAPEGTRRLCLRAGSLLRRESPIAFKQRTNIFCVLKYYFHTFMDSGPAKGKPNKLAVITRAQTVGPGDRVRQSRVSNTEGNC